MRMISHRGSIAPTRRQAGLATIIRRLTICIILVVVLITLETIRGPFYGINKCLKGISSWLRNLIDEVAG